MLPCKQENANNKLKAVAERAYGILNDLDG